MTDQQVKRFKYWEFRTMAMCIFGYALFYFVRKNLSIAMPYLNEEMGISKSDLGLFLTLHTQFGGEGQPRLSGIRMGMGSGMPGFGKHHTTIDRNAGETLG